MARDYQKMYEILKAEKLLNKYNILDTKQKEKNDKEMEDEKKKPKPEKVGKI